MKEINELTHNQLEDQSIFNLEMQLLYLDISIIKENNAYIIKNGIQQSRISEYLVFNSYGNMSFDETDHKHQYPIVKKLNEYTRRKTNCLFYDLTYNTYNNGQYDKLFIYISATKKESYFGYIFYNTKTGKCSNKFLIPEIIDELIISINGFLYSLLNKVIIDFYMKKNNDLNLFKTGIKKTNLYGNISDYNKMKQEYIDRLNIGKQLCA